MFGFRCASPERGVYAASPMIRHQISDQNASLGFLTMKRRNRRAPHASVRATSWETTAVPETAGDEVFARALAKYKDHVLIGAMTSPDPQEDNIKYVTPNHRVLSVPVDEVTGLVNLWTDPDEVIRRIRYHTSPEREFELTYHH